MLLSHESTEMIQKWPGILKKPKHHRIVIYLLEEGLELSAIKHLTSQI